MDFADVDQRPRRARLVAQLRLRRKRALEEGERLRVLPERSMDEADVA